MKIKCRPEDFVVEELPEVELVSQGSLRLYRLEKTGMGTPEVVDLIRRRWNLSASQVKYGGLKDRHARTIQYLTIMNGPDRTLAESSFRVEPLGKVARPYGPGSFRGNRFSLVIRDRQTRRGRTATRTSLLPWAAKAGPTTSTTSGSAPSLAMAGSSAGPGSRATTNRHSASRLPSPTRWTAPISNARKPFSASAGTTGIKPRPNCRARILGASSPTSPTTRPTSKAPSPGSIATCAHSGFQPSRATSGTCCWHVKSTSLTEAHQRTDYSFKTASLPIYHDLEADQIHDLTSLELPLPSARNPKPEGALADCANEVLAPYSLSWDDLRVRGLKDVYLSKGGRAAIIVPESFQTRTFADELYPGRQALELRFELPRGAYATMLVKRLTQRAVKPCRH